jgi:spore maturation protein CgeB
LAGSRRLQRRFAAQGWQARACTWHAAADVRIFKPLPDPAAAAGDLLLCADWEPGLALPMLEEYLIAPVRRLGLRAAVYGVGFPVAARRALSDAGIQYAGWRPTFDLPSVYAQYRVVLHLPSASQTAAGAPSSRVFEALACGRPLLSAAWDDDDQLLQPGRDFALARDAAELTTWLRALLGDANLAHALASQGRRTILARHTCSHRVDQLLGFAAALPRRAHLPSAATPAGRQPFLVH